MSSRKSNPEAWFGKAQQDMQVAELLLAEKVVLTEIVCYHSQQCAEKSLKGFLVSRRIAFKFSHDLVYLIKLCSETDATFTQLLDAAARLSAAAQDVRYPIDEDLEPPSIDIARSAVEYAKSVVAFVRARLQ